MNNYVKINYKGKEYIGQINEIQSAWSVAHTIGNEKELSLQYYNVSIIEKDTSCIIKDIIIHSFAEIKLYDE